MKIKRFWLVTILIFGGLGFSEPKDRLTIDFSMVEKGIEWLDLINTGAESSVVKEFFMSQVAPTGGCQSIIHHWERFRKWDIEDFYAVILTALDRHSTEDKIKDEDGNLTFFGRSRIMWKESLRNTERMRRDLEFLKQADLSSSLQTAKDFLTSDAVVAADFYFVLFGYSTAFSVGKENGIDFLQLPRNKDSIAIDELKTIFAHELHHTGFSYLSEKNLPKNINKSRILLVGILAAEGMPTFFIDKPWESIKRYKSHPDPGYQELARDWEKHTARIKNLYQEAEIDIRKNLAGLLEQKTIMGRWMAGTKGAAYILGADMFSIINSYLGQSIALKVAADCRKFLRYYNYAAEKANKSGLNFYIFDPDLVIQVSHYGN